MERQAAIAAKWSAVIAFSALGSVLAGCSGGGHADRLSHNGNFGNEAGGPGSRMRSPGSANLVARSAEGQFFLDLELLLLERLDHAAVGSGPQHLFVYLALQPLVLRLKGCDMRGIHTRSPYPEGLLPPFRNDPAHDSQRGCEPRDCHKNT